MHRLLVLTLLLCGSRAGLVRVPKIYNALITSDENLSPSQAYPILEPVLRTTALGVAFPPIVVHPQFRNPQREETVNKEESESARQPNVPAEGSEGKKNQRERDPPQLTYHGSLYPLAYDPYVPYGYHHDILYPALPYYQQPVFVDFEHYENNRKADKDAPAPALAPIAAPVPPKPAINFKKNPEIPDVLPPLPIKDERKRKS